MRWVVIGSLVTLVILIIISAIVGIFSFWGFIGIVFYLFLYLGGYLYVRIGMQNRQEQADTTLERKGRFEYCWERVNQILKSMAGGQGIEWASGVGRKSSIKSYFDGIQNKPYRSIIAHLEYSQQLVMIIYDIEGDDIAEFITNPSPELIDNPYLNFKPFSRGVDRNDGLDRFGGYNSGMRYPQGQYGGYPSRGRGRGFSVSFDEGTGGFGEYDQDNRQDPKLTPDRGTVDKALDKLRK